MPKCTGLQAARVQDHHCKFTNWKLPKTFQKLNFGTKNGGLEYCDFFDLLIIVIVHQWFLAWICWCISRFLPFLRNYCRYATHVRRVDHSSDPTLTTSTSSGSSSPATSSASEANKASAKKRVQFSQEVKDNELTSPKLIYDKLPMTSPPRRSQGQPVVIDITKLNAEQGFGFNQYLTSRSDSNAGDYRQQIFESPYFDYRRTHSKVSILISH